MVIKSNDDNNDDHRHDIQQQRHNCWIDKGWGMETYCRPNIHECGAVVVVELLFVFNRPTGTM